MKTALSWSSGKDSAWALHVLRSQGIEVTTLITTVNSTHNRVAMHGVRRKLLEAQARAVGAPLIGIDLPWPCSNEVYEARMRETIEILIAEGFDRIAFGDLFLRDVREYREHQLKDYPLQPVFPLWGIPTKRLAHEMILGGLKARITCIDEKKLDARFAGKEWNDSLLELLPSHVDPCGENGEFHTFTYGGPMFSKPIDIHAGEIVEREGFIFADLMPGKNIMPIEEEGSLIT